MSFSAHSAFLCDRLFNMFCSAADKSASPFGHIKVELCPGLESNSWTKSAKPQCLSDIILFVLLYRNHPFHKLRRPKSLPHPANAPPRARGNRLFRPFLDSPQPALPEPVCPRLHGPYPRNPEAGPRK